MGKNKWQKGKVNTTIPAPRSALFLLLLPSRSDREKVSSKEQKGHRSEDGRGDVGGEGGDGFMVLLSSLPQAWCHSTVRVSSLFLFNGLVVAEKRASRKSARLILPYHFQILLAGKWPAIGPGDLLLKIRCVGSVLTTTHSQLGTGLAQSRS